MKTNKRHDMNIFTKVFVIVATLSIIIGCDIVTMPTLEEEPSAGEKVQDTTDIETGDTVRIG